MRFDDIKICMKCPRLLDMVDLGFPAKIIFFQYLEKVSLLREIYNSKEETAEFFSF